MTYSIDDTDLYLFNTGKNSYTYKMLGAHPMAGSEGDEWRFAVWAPNAAAVSVVGGFNGWDTEKAPMHRLGDSGVWQAHISGISEGELYKYAITTDDGSVIYKADPYALRGEHRPNTASVLCALPEYSWSDSEYIAQRKKRDVYNSPMSIYEVHIGSWRENMALYELADALVDYATDMGYTHIELLPCAEFPLDDSWGYQVTGYYAVSTRYGTPADLMRFVDKCHSRNIGVFLDWVPAHFTRDDHGLRKFDGHALYEHPDKRRGEQPQWGTLLFNYEKPEVRSFLISNAVYLFNEYHIDGLRVDAVSCMLYLDYGKNSGEWLPNETGGNINNYAVSFFRELSKTVNRECESPILIAEESTAFPMVTKPPEIGGLGFNFKWNMGYMNDTLSYMSIEQRYRSGAHGKLTFPMMYAFSENFILPFSHDEIVHGKGSLIGRMKGDYDEQFSQLRLLFAYQFAHPGKKLMFMGCEFGQFIEWDFHKPLDFFLIRYPRHDEVMHFIKKLNHIYTNSAPLYERDTGWDGFEWISADDSKRSIIAFLRKSDSGELLCTFNFSGNDYENMRFETSGIKSLLPVINSDEQCFGGRGVDTAVVCEKDCVRLMLPALSAQYYTVKR